MYITLHSNSLSTYAVDVVVIIENTQQEVVTGTNGLIKGAKTMGPELKKDKTKYLVMTREMRDDWDMVVENYTFQQVKYFKYLGVNIKQHDNMPNEIKLRLSAANKGYYALGKLFKLLSRQSKKRLYSSFRRSILTHLCESRLITKGDEKNDLF